MCKCFEIESEYYDSILNLEITSLLSLLHRMPLLENVLLNAVNINYDMSSASQEEVGHGLVNSIKTLYIGRTQSMSGVVVLLRYLPSLEKLAIDEAEADDKWSINSLTSSLHKLKYFFMNTENVYDSREWNGIRAPS